MKLYYTGAQKFKDPQIDPVKSLGGYISSSEIQDLSLGNLFGDVSKYGIWNRQQSDYRAIAILNDSGQAARNLRAIFQYPDGTDESSSEDDFSGYLCNFQIGWEVAITDSCGDLISSHSVSVPTARPNNVTFYSANGLENALNMPDLVNGQYLIVWIKRTINESAKLPLTDDQYVAIMNKTLILSGTETVALRIIWDGV